MLLGLIMFVVLLSGCACFQEPDFDKPLIVLPPDTVANTQQDQQVKPKPPLENKVWVDAKTSKLWVSQYVDENGDLVEGHYKDIVIEQGHWELKLDAGS